MKAQITFCIAILLIFANAGSADDRPGHYEGKAAATLDAALENLSETNSRIAEMMADGKLEPPELAEIHQLTYTSENSLAKIAEELEALQEVLEAVHKASEEFDTSVVAEQTPVYLETSRKMFGR